MGRATRLRKEHTPTGPDTNTGDRKQLSELVSGGHVGAATELSLQHGPSVYARRGQAPSPQQLPPQRVPTNTGKGGM